jgi:membrane protein YdbS with pleckstrin-like domain
MDTADSTTSAPLGPAVATTDESSGMGDAARPPAGTQHEPIDDGVLRSVDPRSVPADRVAWFILLACVALGEVVGLIVALIGGWLPAWALGATVVGATCLLLIIVWGAVRLPWRVFRTTSYALTPLGVEIRKGIWWRRVINVPRSRIQHTDVIQGPVSRHFGVATLRLHTAGTQHPTIDLMGLGFDRAMAIRDYLIRGGHADAV